ncbi:MAG TPA: CinA family protein [Tahibacter sp.]|nr:CinA family protein [Tahibacter sp.]
MPQAPVPDDAELVRLGEIVAQTLQQRGQMIVTAESCTGGWIAKVLTDIAGSSAWFEAGLVAYSYEAKEALLGVNPHTLERTGAVSQETVVEMVSGALARYGASVAVAVTGIAGPGGATPGKPVGTVWIGWKRRGGYAHAQMFHFDGDREAVRRQTVAAALAGVQKLLSL